MMMKIAEVSFSELLRDVWPFLLVMIAALALVTVWPATVLWLPRLAGYTG
jgi:C4-dicarboxylate transporter, DctM subunit